MRKTRKLIKKETPKKVKSEWRIAEICKKKEGTSCTYVVYRLQDILQADGDKNREIIGYVDDREMAIAYADILNEWTIIYRYLRTQPL